VSNNLAQKRKEANYTQKEVATLLGVTERHYQRIEAATPKAVVQFHKLAQLLNTTVDTLLAQGKSN